MSNERFEGWAGEDHIIFERHSDAGADVTIEVNGVYVDLERVGTMRDGGTRTYLTSAGTLTFPHRMMSPDRTLRWNNVKVLDEDGQEVTRV